MILRMRLRIYVYTGHAYPVNGGHSWRALLRNISRSPAWNIVSSTPLVHAYRARVRILQSLIARHDQAQGERYGGERAA